MNTKAGDVIAYAGEQYDPQHEKTMYVRLDYADSGQENLFAGLYGKVPPTDWDKDAKDLGRIHMDLPEEFDVNEDAIYIIGKDEWGYVISDLISAGFHDDVSFDNEVILYR